MNNFGSILFTLALVFIGMILYQTTYDIGYDQGVKDCLDTLFELSKVQQEIQDIESAQELLKEGGNNAIGF